MRKFLILLFLSSLVSAEPKEIRFADKDKIEINKTKPEITFSKWGECSLKIKCDKTYASATEKDGKVIFSDSDTDTEFYSYAVDNGLKFGLIFKKKPSSNTFSFRLEGWEQFDFFYQPPLKNVNPDGSTWEYFLDGKCTRPAEINGSYAIYHKTKKDHVIGQTNYMTGKFGHILRPRFIDANGKTVWGSIHIENGIYTVTIPQEFLDKATYPVKANDEFGYHTIGGSIADNASNFCIWAKSESTPSSNGTLTGISLYCQLNSGSPQTFNPAIYSDSGGSPDSRLAYGDSGGTAIPGSAAWTETTISYGSITSGTQYWIGLKNNESGRTFYITYDAAAGSTVYNVSQTTWPATANDNSGDIGWRIGIFATYTPATARRVFTVN